LFVVAKHSALVNFIFILIDVCIVMIGVYWLLLTNFLIGRLPGDLAVKKEVFQLRFPIITLLVVIVVMFVISWLFRK
jgi:hypothetical protein